MLETTSSTDRTPTKSRRAAFTLLELTATVSVSVGVIAALGILVSSAYAASLENTAVSEADTRARRVLDRISGEVRFADPGSVSLDAPTDARGLTLARTDGWSGGSAMTTAVAVTFDSATNRVLVAGEVVATGVRDLILNVSNGVLEIEVEVEKTITIRGEGRAISRQASTRLWIGT